MDNMYYSPERFGLTTVGEFDLSEPDYSFDLFVVWHKDGKLYWATDHGCSCPSPFEDLDTLDAPGLENGTKWDAMKAIDAALAQAAEDRWREPDHTAAADLKRRIHDLVLS